MKCKYLSSYIRQQRNSNGNSHVFRDGQPIYTTLKTVRYNRKSEIKDGGRRTGSIYISAFKPDSNSVPTATTTYSGSSNSMALSRIFARCNRKSEIKDGGRRTGSTYISASRLDSTAVPTATPPPFPISGSSNSPAVLPILPDVTGSLF